MERITQECLSAVLTEFGGAGVPIAYLFIEKDISIGFASSWAITHILEQFLRPLHELEFIPSFVGYDEDKSEINVLKQTLAVGQSTTMLLAR